MLDDDERLRPQRRRRSVAHRLRAGIPSVSHLRSPIRLAIAVSGGGRGTLTWIYKIVLRTGTRCRGILEENKE